jgi:hypothetical protein
MVEGGTGFVPGYTITAVADTASTTETGNSSAQNQTLAGSECGNGSGSGSGSCTRSGLGAGLGVGLPLLAIIAGLSFLLVQEKRRHMHTVAAMSHQPKAPQYPSPYRDSAGRSEIDSTPIGFVIEADSRMRVRRPELAS